MKRTLTLLLLALAFYSTAFACSAPPDEQLTPATELVQRTPTIVLARVTKVERGERGTYHYTFKSEKILKGNPADTFIIDGWAPEGADDLETFDDHKNENFWKDTSGRCSCSSDCVIHPTFSPRAIYLIFLEAPYHKKSFERIARLNGGDKWLTWVEEQIKANTAKETNPPSPAAK